MARLLDVARAAGVSRSTVSNVFNNPERVRREVRERVEAAARGLNYAGPDPTARLMRAGKVNAIGVVMGDRAPLPDLFRHPYPREFLAGIGEVCDEQGVSLALITGFGDEAAGGTRNAIVDGFIVSTEEEIAEKTIDIARRRNLPFVLMDIDAGPDANSVRVDDRDGARQAAQHLVELGHRRFAILSTLRARGREPLFHAPRAVDHGLAVGYAVDEERLSAWAEVLLKAGIAINDVPIVESLTDPDSLAKSAALLLDRAPEATAILTGADTHAISVLDEARRRGRVVPRDLSVVGFDDYPEAARADPPLTTVAQPIVEKGRIAARILFAEQPPRHVVLPLELVVRESTGPAPG